MLTEEQIRAKIKDLEGKIGVIAIKINNNQITTDNEYDYLMDKLSDYRIKQLVLQYVIGEKSWKDVELYK